MDYMLKQNALLLIVALVIGIIIGLWIWNRRRIAPTFEINEDATRPTFARGPANTEPGIVNADEALAASLIVSDPILGMPAPIMPLMPEETYAEAMAEAEGKPDNLLLLKGVGPKLSALLNALGVTSFRQIADWTPDQAAAVDAQLGTFKGRIERDRWQDQAALLAAGDMATFEQRYGKAGG